MFLDKFEVGKRYRFTIEKYLESCKSWVNEIDQKEVLVQHEGCGHIGDYIVNPHWCEEIVTEPLKTRDDIKDMYEQLLYLEELEETLDVMVEPMIDSQMKSNFVKYINSEIERVIDELGLEE